jgi:hypothetical protein
MRRVPKLRTTAGSLRTSKREEISTWSEPRVTTCAEERLVEYQPRPQLSERGKEEKRRARKTHQRQETIPRQRHDITLQHGRLKPQHLRVHIERTQRSGGDDDGGEAFEDGGDGEGGVEADEVEDGVGDGGVVGFEGLEEETETCAYRGGRHLSTSGCFLRERARRRRVEAENAPS